jgi:hypothetical protein
LVSKVKLRKTPAVVIKEIVVDDLENPEVEETMNILDTPIRVIQDIGVNLCDVPLEELSPKKLFWLHSRTRQNIEIFYFCLYQYEYF